jgi:cytochrome c oxidase cbb3-type subunit IV
MRLARSVLNEITGMEIFATIGILIFFTFFIVLIIWVVRMRKRKIEEYSRMPLANDEDDAFSETAEKTDNEQSNKN